MNNFHNSPLPYYRGWISVSNIYFDFFWMDIGPGMLIYIFNAHIQCIGEHKIVENGFIYINIKN